MRKYLISFLVIAIFSITAVSANTIFERKTALVRDDYVIKVNGEQVNLNNKIMTIDNVTYIAVREVSTVLGNEVDFNKGVIDITQNNTNTTETVDADEDAEEIKVTEPNNTSGAPSVEERRKQLIFDTQLEIEMNEKALVGLNENIQRFKDMGRDDLVEQTLEMIELNKQENINLKAKLAELQK